MSRPGNFPLIIGGVTYQIRPTMAMLSDIEDSFGGLLALGKRFQDGDWKVTELVRLLHLLIRNHDQALDEDCLADVVLKDGAATYAPRILEFLVCALTGKIPDKTA